MRAEVLAIGTELLLGQVVDTNSSWIGGRLAEAGIDCYYQAKVGDNHARIVRALRDALARSDAVICCGGLGPTQDDITREAIAEVMGVPLVRDDSIFARIQDRYRARDRQMPESNLRQADVPVGARTIEQVRGTAPGLICPLGQKVVYAVPGVPHEMREMVERAVVADLAVRAGATSTIRSRTLRTWGLSESALAERVGDRVRRLDEAARTEGVHEAAGGSVPTIAFLASGVEGIRVRVTVKAPTPSAAAALLDAEELALRGILGELVFGVDDQTMEMAVAGLLSVRGWTLGLAESITGGMVGQRLTSVPGASDWFRGSIVSYSTEVKRDLLDVPAGPVVSETAARAMAEGARRLLGADVGLGVTGVAGPTEQDGQPVGTVFCAVALPGDSAGGGADRRGAEGRGDEGRTEVARLTLPGDRDIVRHLATISLLDLLRRRLIEPNG